MKNILIISEPRTGSSNLLKSIASAYNFEYQFEPDKQNKLKIKDNTVVKIIVDYDGTKTTEYYLNLIQSS